MSRAYRSVRPKSDRVYDVDDVMQMYSVSRNTPSNWIAGGLRPIDDRRPQMFRGAELKRFHEARRLSNTSPMRPSEFRCFRCDARVVPDIDSMEILVGRNGAPIAKALCPDCGAMVGKSLDATKCDSYRKCIESNTSLRSLDEQMVPVPAGIGKCTVDSTPAMLNWNPDNERIVHAYQLYGGRYSTQTLDAHLSSIRGFEHFVGLAPLAKVTPAEAARYRAHLAHLGEVALSRSTIRHRASHLHNFFRWLVDQKSGEELNRTLCDYFLLSKKDAAKAIQPADRPIPTLDQVLLVLSSMPTHTRVQRRDRAIVAATFLFGTRAAATASLLLGLIDVQNRKVRQDATIVRVKNSKSQTTFWFPFGDPFDEIVTCWIKELRDLGFGDADPLFPPDAALNQGPHRRELGPITPWRTKDGIGRAFERGCASAGVQTSFNPHSARHCVVAMAGVYCRTEEEVEAWSHNLGHSSVKVTRTHYNKMTDTRRDEAFSGMTRRDPLSNDKMELLLRYHEHELERGTPEFEEAHKLAQARMARGSLLKA